MLTDPRVFDDAHVPRTLEHRETTVEALSRALKPALDGRCADDVLLSGPSGVGKTVLARHVLRRVSKRAAVASVHMRCLGKTAGTVLREAIERLPITEDVHRGMTVDELVRVLREGTDAPTVLVLDEGDDLPETELLDILDGIPLVSVVAICHKPESWRARLERLDASFEGEQHLALERYRVDELADILQVRADRGLRDGAADRQLLETIADRAAGVARQGIQALRCAAEVAGEEGAEAIRDGHVERGFERAREQIREANLRSLPLHHHVVYELVREHGPLSGRELHKWYDRVAEEVYKERQKTPVTSRYRRTVLRKLESYDLIGTEKSNGSARYWAVDEELGSELGLSVEAEV